jgi:hypothetical protein
VHVTVGMAKRLCPICVFDILGFHTPVCKIFNSDEVIHELENLVKSSVCIIIILIKN